MSSGSGGHQGGTIGNDLSTAHYRTAASCGIRQTAAAGRRAMMSAAAGVMSIPLARARATARSATTSNSRRSSATRSDQYHPPQCPAARITRKLSAATVSSQPSRAWFVSEAAWPFRLRTSQLADCREFLAHGAASPLSRPSGAARVRRRPSRSRSLGGNRTGDPPTRQSRHSRTPNGALLAVARATPRNWRSRRRRGSRHARPHGRCCRSGTGDPGATRPSGP